MDAVDDPYKFLAHTLVVTCPDKELSRILHDAKAIRRKIAEEVNNADFVGDFIDCIMVGLIKSGKSRCVHTTLKATTDFFYSNLDIPRLRKEIVGYCEKYGKPMI